MKPSILKRIESLEQSAIQRSRPPLWLLDILTLDLADREEYWSGDANAVLTRIGVPVGGESTGQIRTIQIDIHPESRDRWLETHDLDETALEDYEQRVILEDQRREAAERDARERAALDAIRNSRPLLPVPANAYTPAYTPVPVERD